MGHVRNLDLSDLFLNIYHFYMKALLNFPQKFTIFTDFLNFTETMVNITLSGILIGSGRVWSGLKNIVP